jgi:hypothetical protein
MQGSAEAGTLEHRQGRSASSHQHSYFLSHGIPAGQYAATAAQYCLHQSNNESSRSSVNLD